MDKSIVKGLNDKLYEKRKATALELERLVKQCVINGDYTRIDKIISELCRDYAYALHQPMARNAGLMGLAATAIALGTNEVGKYLGTILPPVLACFGDQNDQMRFYACESLYNIAKISKGEILIYFNEIFDVLCKISADTEDSVRGAAELLDRLIKDIVAEKASTYISIVNNNPESVPPAVKPDPISGNVYQETYEQDPHLAFSLPKFIPLLKERIYVINPDTRIFLVDWIRVLLNAPGLELTSFLPSFLGGLFTFLGDSHKDVRVVTSSLMDQLLQEVNRIAHIQQQIKEKNMEKQKLLLEDMSKQSSAIARKEEGTLIAERKKTLMSALSELSSDDNLSKTTAGGGSAADSIVGNGSTATSVATTNDINNNNNSNNDNNNIINNGNISGETGSLHTNEAGAGKKLAIVPSLDTTESIRDGEEYIPGQDIKLDFPEVISILVNNLASSESDIQEIALHWMDSILLLSPNDFIPFFSKILTLLLKLLSDQNPHVRELAHVVNEKLLLLCDTYENIEGSVRIAYGSMVNGLTLQFFDSKVETKMACMDWFILIYKKAPNEILEHDDSMFLTLLKSLSNKDPRLIEKSLSLLKSLCSKLNDIYLTRFLDNFVTLLRRDTQLLKFRANYIMRKICATLTPERVYKVISSILNANDDIMFVRTMIQILSTNLIVAPEMYSLRHKLKDTDNVALFTLLFKSWCHNPVSVISLCFVAERYELAYSSIQVYGDQELHLYDLVQLDILVQLFESPLFSRMRLQLIEYSKYPYLYRSLYGILMMLPQSKAFDTLNRRLSSVNVWLPPQVFQGASAPVSASVDSSNDNCENSQGSSSKTKPSDKDLEDYLTQTLEAERSGSDYVQMKVSELPIFGNYIDGSDGNTQRSMLPLRLGLSDGDSLNNDTDFARLDSSYNDLEETTPIRQRTASIQGSAVSRSDKRRNQ